jgi:hypothetical protein
MVEQRLWWKQPLRVIQTNLQVLDSALIDPERVARQISELGANTLVMNVGGIYAWYPTRVPGHRVNMNLPKDYDLLRCMIDSCHSRGIRLIARFDFSKTDDANYQLRPWWFRRLPGNLPRIIASERPGEWPLLYETCINGGYRNNDVAAPALREVLEQYDVDGIFYNAPLGAPCCCDACRRKYRLTYGKELPTDPALYGLGGRKSGNASETFEPDWFSRCLKDNMANLRDVVKSVRPDVPSILYYNIYNDSLYDRLATCDMLCTEPTDFLSGGWTHIPQFWKPALAVKLGRSEQTAPRPFGIIHSASGMDWRHTGLPPAEYRFWLSQVPANGGMIWHSLTGVPDTITDKRILDCVSELNHNIKRVESDMHGAKPLARIALMWNMQRSAEGWADMLVNRQIQFNVMLEEQAAERLREYSLVIVPAGFDVSDEFADMLVRFAHAGGRLIIEGRIDERHTRLYNALGIENRVFASEQMTACYMRLEREACANEGVWLARGFERTPIIPHRGVVYYAAAKPDARTLATFVPPFSPLEGCGAPPERASIPNPYTDIPLIVSNKLGAGRAIWIAYEYGALVAEFRLGEFFQLGLNMVHSLLGEDLDIDCTHINGLQMIAYQTDGKILVHLINGVGQRPLSENTPLHNIRVRVKARGVSRCRCAILGEELPFSTDGDWVEAVAPALDVWEMIVFYTSV